MPTRTTTSRSDDLHGRPGRRQLRIVSAAGRCFNYSHSKKQTTTVQDYEFHEVANLFPLLHGEEFENLKADIAENGQREPIWVTPDGQILDGRNRYRACKDLGQKVDARTYEGEDYASLVVSLNLQRRHLSSQQKAALATQLEEYEAKRARDRKLSTLKQGDEKPDTEKFPYRDAGEARQKAAQQIGTNPRYVSDAKRIKRDAPDVFERMERGEYGSMAEANRVAKLPKEDRDEVHSAVESGEAESSKAARSKINKRKKEERIRADQKKAPALDGLDERFPVVYADPPWRYNFSRSESRKIENQYGTMPVDKIKSLPVSKIATEDAVLFLWATSPKVPQALKVMEAWDFCYRTSMVWVKDKIGMGYWARSQHELLLVGKRGDISPPPAEARASSVISAPRDKEHSRKPADAYRIIEAAFPDFAKIELFSRASRKGWDAWGADA